MPKRILLDGSTVEELLESRTLVIKTKCPEKWMLVDKETGEVYTGHVTDGKNSWKKIATWDKNNARH
jgi:hypothetical protein